MIRGLTGAGAAQIAWEAHGPEGAPTIVLCHSLGLDSSMWHPQIAALATRYRLVTVDMRGHGRSPANGHPETLESLADDVIAAADDAALDRFHLAGLSLGGQIGVSLAIHHPWRLHSLIACNTAARIGSAQSWAERIAAVRAGGLAAIAPGVIERAFSPDFAHRHPDWLAAATQTLRACDPLAYVACCEVLSQTDLGERVAAIAVPTLVVGGELDTATPPEQARSLHDQIPGSRLAILPGAAHLSNLDRAESFTATLIEFLEQVGPT